MSNRAVTQALLHGPVFVPGVGQLPAQLANTLDRSGKIKTLKMELTDMGYLLLKVNDVEVGIPLANVQIFTLASNKPDPKGITNPKE